MDYTISLYYIEGINSTDTPFFSNKGEQSTYFSNHLVASIASSYYPPYYRNRIRLSSDDITFESSINYLSLNNEDRTYYYFISSFRYITDGIIELDIDMDVIQTYFFDITCRHGVIERKFIDRYNIDNTFNRNYIRENVSEGVSIKGKTNYIKSSTNWYIFRLNKALNVTPQYKYGTNNAIASSSTLGICPADFNEAVQVSGEPANTLLGSYIFNNLATGDYVENISYVPFDCFKGHYTKTSTTYAFNSSDYSTVPIDNIRILTHKEYTFSASTKAPIISYSWNELKSIEIDSYQNKELGVEFNKDFVPAIIDECYQQLYYGENSAMTMCSLRMLQTNSIKLMAMFDFDTLNRIYGFNFDGTDINDPSYNTVVSTNSSIDLTLITSTLRSFMAQNKNSFFGGMLLSLMKGE